MLLEIDTHVVIIALMCVTILIGFALVWLVWGQKKRLGWLVDVLRLEYETSLREREAYARV